MNIFHRAAFLFMLSCATTIELRAQPFDVDAQKQGLKGGVHWIKRTWYNAKPGTNEADKSSIPDIYLHPNQLIEYSKDGKLRGVMDYPAGTNEGSGTAETWSYANGRMSKHTKENDRYEAVYSTTYTYDADGNEIKAETQSGPGDKMGIFRGMATTDEATWRAGRRASLATRGSDGRLIKTTAFTYDGAGRVTREDYTPIGLYSARTYAYDAKGQLTKDAYLDKSGQPSTIWTYENNTAGKPLKRTMTNFYQGKKDGEEITTYTYNTQGDLTAQKTMKDGKTTYDYAWQHTYDAKGNRIQTVHIKAGKPEMVEVLELRYY